MKRTLFLRVFLGYAAVIVLLAAAVTVFAPPLMRTHHVEEQALALEHTAQLLESSVLPYLTGTGSGDLAELVSSAGKKTGKRITVIDKAGRVLADSEDNAGDMENHLFRPEIQSALRGEKQMSIRESTTLKREMMYMSIPLESGGEVLGVLRLSMFTRDLEALLAALRHELLRIVGLVTLLALGLAFVFTRSISRPIRELVDASSRVSSGDFEASVSTRRSGEMKSLALSFNDMAGKLRAFFEEIRLQNEEIDGIMASAREGLCVIGADSRIVLSNAEFRRIIQNEAPEGKYIWEVVRSSGLGEIVRKALESRQSSAGAATIVGRDYSCHTSYLAAGNRLVITLHETSGGTEGH
jgi:two-component system phosphate regulon sensor histidine kinase PhoR